MRPTRILGDVVTRLVFVLLLGLGASGCTSVLFCPLPADDGTVEVLIAAMGERLAVMPAVAEWKRRHNRPVVDPERENVVLDNGVEAARQAALQAELPPFPEPAIRAFYRAQIDAAVTIQQKLLARPASTAGPIPDLATEIRPALDRTGARIAELLVRLPPRLDRQQVRAAAHEAWQIDGLDAPEIDRLVDALVLLAGTRAP